ncbi:hypothetical protein Goari_007773, partial [Gossypium aridum]|nr:hypothetical protein [Gossypium aridum]
MAHERRLGLRLFENPHSGE